MQDGTPFALEVVVYNLLKPAPEEFSEFSELLEFIVGFPSTFVVWIENRFLFEVRYESVGYRYSDSDRLQCIPWPRISCGGYKPDPACRISSIEALT